jgi:hypothetical protein
MMSPGQPDVARHLMHDPLSLSDYGMGAYLSPNAGRAVRYAGGEVGGWGCLLLCRVALGSTETVMQEDPERACPSPGYHSLVVPGRRDPSDVSGVGGGGGGEEYVIFDSSQILPLYCVHVSA